MRFGTGRKPWPAFVRQMLVLHDGLVDGGLDGSSAPGAGHRRRQFLGDQNIRPSTLAGNPPESGCERPACSSSRFHDAWQYSVATHLIQGLGLVAPGPDRRPSPQATGLLLRSSQHAIRCRHSHRPLCHRGPSGCRRHGATSISPKIRASTGEWRSNCCRPQRPTTTLPAGGSCVRHRPPRGSIIQTSARSTKWARPTVTATSPCSMSTARHWRYKR